MSWRHHVPHAYIDDIVLGPVSLTVFPSQFKFDGNFVSISPRLHNRDRYKILYMARQLCCRGMCKNLLRSDGQQRSYGKAKFPSYLNCGQKTVSETGPGSNLVQTLDIFIASQTCSWFEYAFCRLSSSHITELASDDAMWCHGNWSRSAQILVRCSWTQCLAIK